MDEKKIEQLEKRVADLELFAEVAARGMIGLRTFLNKSIKENDNGTQETVQPEAK